MFLLFYAGFPEHYFKCSSSVKTAVRNGKLDKEKSNIDKSIYISMFLNMNLGEIWSNN